MGIETFLTTFHDCVGKILQKMRQAEETSSNAAREAQQIQIRYEMDSIQARCIPSPYQAELL